MHHLPEGGHLSIHQVLPEGGHPSVHHLPEGGHLGIHQVLPEGGHPSIHEVSPEGENTIIHQDLLQRQGEHQQELREGQDEEWQDEDTPMTPYEVREHTGKRKRATSPPALPSHTRSGRTTVRHDYKRLHMGAAATTADPKNHHEALSGPHAHQWKAAMVKELRSLEDTGTIEWIKRSQMPKGRKPLTGKWVFKTKYLPDGTIEKHKARWTARGFTQRQGLDYTSTFAPTPRAATGRIILALATQFGWHRRQVDVETAFLNPDIDRQIFIQPPEGMKAKTDLIKIRKGMYGLKQAAALWYQDAVILLEKLGLRRTVSDACLFMGKDILVLMHVDDFQILSPSLKKVDWLIKSMRKTYNIKLVDTNLFLGLHITENQKTHSMKVSQQHYSKDKLKGHNLENAKGVKYPLDHLCEPSDSPCTKQQYDLFNRIIGELQHLSNHTRPDITHAVNHLARFLQNPSSVHINSAKHIWKYIAGTIDKGLTFTKGEKLKLRVYSDSDFAGDPSTSRSTSGSLIELCGSPVVWRSQLQKEVVLSSTEAEYLALTETTREVCWFRNLLNELKDYTGIIEIKKVKIHVDNQSAIALVRDHTNSRRSRHVSLRNHYCREQHERGMIEVEYISTTRQMADALTKARSPNALLRN